MYYKVNYKKTKQIQDSIDILELFSTCTPAEIEAKLLESISQETTPIINKFGTITTKFNGELTQRDITNIPFEQASLTYTAEHPNFEADYYEFHIPKRSGGLRTITAPNPELKQLQSDYVKMLEDNNSTRYHNSCYSYTKGRSAADAVRVHQANKSNWFIKLDIKNFFPSISIS